MLFTYRRMKMSEHSDDSWDDLFGSDDPRNYAVLCGERTIDSCLTFGEAQGLVFQLEDEARFDALFTG